MEYGFKVRLRKLFSQNLNDAMCPQLSTVAILLIYIELYNVTIWYLFGDDSNAEFFIKYFN